MNTHRTAALLHRLRPARSWSTQPLIFVATCVLTVGIGGSASAQSETPSGEADAGGTTDAAVEADDAKSGKKTAKEIAALSLVEKAPVVLDINRRYYQFYGDPFTARGDLFERTQLTGDWGGARDSLADAGLYLDIGLTQNFMSNVHGGTSTGGLQYTGSLDLYGNIDTAKLTNGAWPGATIFLHGETRWGNGVQPDAGSAIPPTFDDTMPRATTTDDFQLSEYYLVQAVSDELSFWVGQMNGAGLVDGNAFANSEKHQFMNTALVDNPILGPFAPYTAFTAAAVYMPSPNHVFISSVMDGDGSVTQSVASTYRGEDTVFVGSYAWLPEFNGLPGRYQIVGAYTGKDFTDYALGNRLELARILAGIDTPNEVSDNYVVIGTFDQYLHVQDKKRNTGWGLFARFGWAPKNRNVIDQFYSFGVGGKGCLIPGREDDFWGVGWAGTHFSQDLRQDLGFLNVNVEEFEHVIEAFYNIELTPAAHLTLDAQYVIDPFVAQVRNDTGRSVNSDSSSLVLGMRLQLDF